MGEVNLQGLGSRSSQRVIGMSVLQQGEQVVSKIKTINSAEYTQRKREREHRAAALPEGQNHEKGEINRNQIFTQERSEHAERRGYPRGPFLLLPCAREEPKSDRKEEDGA